MALSGQTVLWGTSGGVTFPSGQGFLAAAVRVSVRQGIATATGFGKSWRIKHGTVQDYSVSISGVLTGGTAGDTPPSTLAQGGQGTVVATFNTTGGVCSFSDVMIQSENTLGTSIESAGDASYSFEGPVSFAGPVFTWQTS